MEDFARPPTLGASGGPARAPSRLEAGGAPDLRTLSAEDLLRRGGRMATRTPTAGTAHVPAQTGVTQPTTPQDVTGIASAARQGFGPRARIVPPSDPAGDTPRPSQAQQVQTARIIRERHTIPAVRTAHGPGLTPQAVQHLDRLAVGMAKSSRPGPVVTDVAGAIRTGGDAGRAETRYLLSRLDELSPTQARGLRDALAESFADTPDLLHGAFPEHHDGETVSLTLSGTPQKAEAGPPDWPVNDGRNRTFNDALANTKRFEGGYADREKSEDGRGPTMKGISKATLDEVRALHPEWRLPADPKNLTDEQIDGIYRFDYFDRPKLDKMAAIPGMDGRLVSHIFDAGVLHSTDRAGRWLQKALDDTLGTNLKTRGKDGTLHYDGSIGPQTRAALAEAVKQGRLKEINNAVGRQREAFMRSLPRSKKNPGWFVRARSFHWP